MSINAVQDEITDSTILGRPRHLEIAQVKREAIILDVETGRYYGLNPIGLRIFELLGTPMRVADLVNTLSQDITVDPQRLRADIVHFLNDLAEQGLVYVVGDEPEA